MKCNCQINKFIIGSLAVLVLAISCDGKMHKQYHVNGQLKAISPLKNGKYHGRAFFYGEDGELSSECNFEDGLRQGKGLFYYQDGVIKQIVFYHNDTIVKSATYRNDGSLEMIKEYNVAGKLIDYNYYLDSGRIDPDLAKKYPIFVTESDTIVKGQIYSGEIRLGHRFYEQVFFVFGDTINPVLNSRPYLKRSSNHISKFSIDTDTCSTGTNILTGLVLELADTCDNCGWMAPFKHEYHVLPSSN